jgi:hypothetical protein
MNIHAAGEGKGRLYKLLFTECSVIEKSVGHYFNTEALEQGFLALLVTQIPHKVSQILRTQPHKLIPTPGVI